MPAAAQKCKAKRLLIKINRLVGKNVFFRPSRQVEFGACRQEAETGLGELAAPLADQELVELGAQRMQVQDVRGRIFELRRRQLGRPPVRRLLLLGQLDAEQVLAQVFEAV